MRPRQRLRLGSAEFPGGDGGAGGFDAVIGNPPYIRIQALQEWAPLEVEHYKRAYRAASKGNYDIYVVFVEKGLALLNERGRLGFILPHKFFNAQYGEPLRELLAEGRHLSKVVHFGDQQVFEGATTYTCLLFLEKGGRNEFQFVRGARPGGVAAGEAQVEGTIPAASVGASEWNFVVGRGSDLFERLRAMPVKLGDVAHIFVGLQTSADECLHFEISKAVGDDCVPLGVRKHGQLVRLEQRPERSVSVTVLTYRQPLTHETLAVFPYLTLEEDRCSLLISGHIASDIPSDGISSCSNQRMLSRNARRASSKGATWYGYMYRKNMHRHLMTRS